MCGLGLCYVQLRRFRSSGVFLGVSGIVARLLWLLLFYCVCGSVMVFSGVFGRFSSFPDVFLRFQALYGIMPSCVFDDSVPK